MVKCPYCRVDICALDYWSDVSVVQECSLCNHASELEYDSISDYGSHSNETWHCKECNEIVATTEEDALKFLQGKKIKNK